MKYCFNIGSMVGEIAHASTTKLLTLHENHVWANVLSCSPTVQGVITSATKVIVSQPPKLKFDLDGPNQVSINVDLLRDLVLSPTFFGNVLELDSPRQALRVVELQATDHIESFGIDLNNSIIMSYSQMARLGILEGDKYVFKAKRKSISCRVYGINDIGLILSGESKSADVICGPAAFFNLECHLESMPLVELVSSEISSHHIPVASELLLSVVLGPSSDDRPALDSALVNLSEWLKAESRLLSVGDIIPIQVNDHEPVHETSLIKELQRVLVPLFHPLASILNINMSALLYGASGSGKRTTVNAVARHLHVQIHEVDCFDLVEDSVAKTTAQFKKHLDLAKRYSPVVLYFRNIDALVKKENGPSSFDLGLHLNEFFDQLHSDKTISPIISVASTVDIERIPDDIQSLFRYTYKCEACPTFLAPSESERIGIIKKASNSLNISPESSLKEIALQTAGFTSREVSNVVSLAYHFTVQRALKGSDLEDSVSQGGLQISLSDLNNAVSSMRSSQKESLGAPKIPKVSWDDVGGLDHVKEAVADTIQLPLERPELFAKGVKKRSELLNMYIGESEANVRRVFERARDAKPCVIFFDELDSVAPKRGEKGDSGGVMDRIVSQLLAELDSVNGGDGGDVFVIGATNRPDLLDPALLRPGRFDRLLYLGVNDTHSKQENVLKALTRKFPLDPALNLAEVAKRTPLTLTGADIYALCSDAMLKSINRTIAKVEEDLVRYNEDNEGKEPVHAAYYLEAIATLEQKSVLVTMADFTAAIDELRPSVSEADLMHYRAVQEKFK
ncbi:peroxisomal assembly protein [Phlyctochytrium planicorne]|nr:peroxisomal assembly protein [Phlyctochytrium planicorne]